MSSQTTIQLTPAEPVDKVICKLCRRQFSKYTCPTCNVPYCSLTCFRSESHTQCSESFYKKEVESDIQSNSKSPQERMKMLELLKSFEQKNSGVKDLGVEDYDDNEDDDFVSRFQDVDLNATSADDLWPKLTTAEQKQFMKILEDPKSEIAQQLLASKELEDDQQEPWWEAPIAVDDDTNSIPDLRRCYGIRPEVLKVPVSLVKPWPNGPSLAYNLCAICIAYSYATRHLAISPLSTVGREATDIQEAQKLVSHLVPFLVNRKSTMVYSELSQLIPDLWSRFQPGEMNSKLFSLLLGDAARLIRPLPVTTVPSDTAHPTDINPTSHAQLNVILVLSDLSKLFGYYPPGKVPRAEPNHVMHKLMYYAAHILSAPPPVLCALVKDILVWQKTSAYEETSDHITSIMKERRRIIQEI